MIANGPSENGPISGHPRLSPLDCYGHDFPSGSSLFLDCLCGPNRRTFGLTNQGGGCYIQHDSAVFAWIVEYENDDPSRLSFKAPNGQYLAAANTGDSAPLCLNANRVMWRVYQGDAQGKPLVYWLQTEQCQDTGFLSTWNNSGNDGAGVWVYTNRDPNGNWRGNNGWQDLESWSPGMSWQLRPTHQYEQWKAKQRAAGSCCFTCTGCTKCQQAVKDSEAAKASEQAATRRQQELDQEQQQLRQREEVLRQRQQAIEPREQQVQQKENNMRQREQSIAPKEQKLQQKEADIKKREDGLSQREQKVKQGEQRIKNSNKAGAAEHLEHQKKADELEAQNKYLLEELEASKRRTQEAEDELEQEKKRMPKSAATTPAAASQPFNTSGRGIPPPIRPVSRKQPAKTLPAKTLPSRERPAAHLPRSWSGRQLDRFTAGQKAMKAR